MKLVIGVVGENGAGKGTVANILASFFGEENIARLRFSDVLYKTLKLWNLPATRANLQALPVAMVAQFGKGTLTNAVGKHIARQQKKVVIVEGIRWFSDIPMIRSFINSQIIYVTAKPKIRYERMKGRGEKVGEKEKTYQEFLKEEKAKTEVEIKRIGKDADFKIINNTSLSDLKKQLKQFYFLIK